MTDTSPSTTPAVLAPVDVAIPALIESARCLGVAQAKGDAQAVPYWEAKISEYSHLITARAEPKAAPVDVAAVLDMLDTMARRGAMDDRLAGWELATLREARAAVERMAAALAAAREEKDRLRSGLTACLKQAEADILALRQRAEAAEADAVTERALQRAAKELPEGWLLSVEVERGAGWVELRDAAFAEIELANDGDTLAENITAAIDAALQEPRP